MSKCPILQTYPILIVLHLLTIIFTSTLTSGEKQKGRSLRIRQKEPTNKGEGGIKMEDNRDKRLLEIIMVEKARNKSTKRSRKPGISKKRDNLVYRGRSSDTSILGWK